MSILFLGGYLITDKFKNSKRQDIRLKKNRYKEITDFVKLQLNKKEIDDVFSKTGLQITNQKYQLWRYIIFIVFTTLLAIAYVKNGNVPNKYFAIIIVLFFSSSPTLYFFRYRTPFHIVTDMLKIEYRNKKDIELYRAISQLKNIAIAQQGRPLGGDFIIEQLMKFTELTKKDFTQLLSEFRIGNEEEACRKFAKNIDTKLGLEFSNVLLKLDHINPVELKEQLVLYQENVKAERLTIKLRRNETRSTLLFIPITTLALMVLLNFVIIVIFIDQMQNIMSL